MALFISFEGIDGSGKTTQVRNLKAFLEQKGLLVAATREPGGTDLAEKIRSLILSNAGIEDPLTEILLLSAARRDHYNNLIKKNIDDNVVVISDRFYDSSLIYQGVVKGLGMDKVMQITQIAIGNAAPDVTFLLDSDPEISQKRMSTRAEDRNVYDDKSIEFHKKLRAGFLQIASQHPSRIKIINADQSPQEVSEQINQIINKLI